MRQFVGLELAMRSNKADSHSC